VFGRAILEECTIHVPDLLADSELDPRRRQDYAGVIGIGGGLGVPLRREGTVVGVFTLQRREAGAFTDKQIELVETFADQAVIAIENARLFNEVQAKTHDLEEALRYQTGSGNILNVIASSPTDVQPVLEAIVKSACDVCDAYDAAVHLKDGSDLLFSAHHGPIPFAWDLGKRPINRHWTVGRAVLDRQPVMVSDFLGSEGDDFPEGREMSRRQGHRCTLSVPLLREGEAIGAIALRRMEPVAFNEKQIALLQTFADQAVIAIGNVRLFDEVQAKTHDLEEALRYQTGSANILNVIASSPTDVSPVLKAIVESACEICDAYDAGVLLKIGDDLHYSAQHGPIPAGQRSVAISREWVTGRSVVDKVPVQVSDFEAPEAAEFPEGQRHSREQGHRCTLAVPLLREGEAIGAIVLRRLEPVAFNDKQIDILQTFADQAVIAIGNVRLFEEVQAKTRDLEEALTYQTGSANILNVIASSPTDVEPVLNAIVEGACKLCEANDAAVLLKDGAHLRFRAHHGPIDINLEKFPITRGWTAGRAFLDGRPVHLRDTQSEEAKEFPDSRALAVPPYTNFSVRTVLSVPLLRESERVGVILLRRIEMRPFSDKQIALLQTFADQAVIAINNARLFDEVQAKTRDLEEALVYQTGSSNILKVIASSPTDVGPALKAIVDSACEICDAYDAVVLLKEGDDLVVSAHHGPIPPNFKKNRISRNWVSGRAVVDKLTQHVSDMLGPEGDHFPEGRGLARQGGHRTVLSVPLLREGEAIGAIALRRREMQPFNERQIELLKSFADQAVIGISNVRLFEQVQERTRELSRSLEDLRTAQDRLIQTEKLASLGQVTAGIAHEIKNPLNFVNNFSALSVELTDELNDILKQAKLAEKIQQEVAELTQMLKSNLDKVVQHGKRADSIVKNMLLHSREGSGEHRPVEINTIIDESLNLAYHGARAEGRDFNITLERDLDPGAGIADIYPQEITRVLLNLISNGFYAATKRAAANGGLEPKLKATTRNLGDKVEIRIRDNGIGIPSEIREKIFNPFFTTKPAGEGTGLGLSMSHDIVVKQHGGAIEVATEPGVFTEFIITLPRMMPAQREAGGHRG